jgi:hypothetical protein
LRVSRIHATLLGFVRDWAALAFPWKIRPFAPGRWCIKAPILRFNLETQIRNIARLDTKSRRKAAVDCGMYREEARLATRRGGKWEKHLADDG